MPYFLQSTPAKYHKLPPSAEEAAAQCFCLFTAVLQSCPCASSIINEASCLCKYTSSAEIGGWRAIKQICQGTAAPSQALQFVTRVLCREWPQGCSVLPAEHSYTQPQALLLLPAHDLLQDPCCLLGRHRSLCTAGLHVSVLAVILPEKLITGNIPLALASVAYP